MMKAIDGKTVEIADEELFRVYLSREIDEVMSYREFKDGFKELGCIIVEK